MSDKVTLKEKISYALVNLGNIPIQTILASYLLIGVLFPVMDISLNSMLPVMTTDMEERNMLSSLKGVVYMVGMFGLSFLREDIMRKEKHFPWRLPQMQIMPMQEWKKIRRKQGRILRHCLMYIQRLSIME